MPHERISVAQDQHDRLDKRLFSRYFPEKLQGAVARKRKWLRLHVEVPAGG